MKEATHENILAANAYAFFQAKSIRQTSLKIALTDLELQLVRDQAMPISTKEIFQKKIDDYKKTIDRYESEPDTREGKKELLARAKKHEKTRVHAMRQDPWFDYAEGMLQIAIVLLSVSILGSIPSLFIVGSILGLLGLLSTLNGFLLEPLAKLFLSKRSQKSSDFPYLESKICTFPTAVKHGENRKCSYSRQPGLWRVFSHCDHRIALTLS